MDDKITSSSLAIQSLHSFTSQCDQCSMLCSCLDLDISLTKYREIESTLDTQCCLSRRYRYTIVEIGSIPSQPTLTIWHSEFDIEITSTIISFVSFTSDFYGHTIFDSLWDIDSLFYFFFEFSFSMTVSTFVYNSLSCSRTGTTWSSLFHDTEYCLYPFTHLTLPTTCCTGLCSPSFATTVMTGCSTVKLDLASSSSDRILERYTESHLDILSYISSRPRASPTTHPSTKK